LTRQREHKHVNGYLNFGASIDDITVSFWGELPGLDSRIVEKAVDQRADEIIAGETTLGVAERRPWPWSPSAKTVSTPPGPPKARPQSMSP
jgi:hypothetical protein